MSNFYKKGNVHEFYDFVEELGEGAFAQVYKAIRKSDK